jgi:hypothetical protein
MLIHFFPAWHVKLRGNMVIRHYLEEKGFNPNLMCSSLQYACQ